MDLRQYLMMLRRWGWLIALGAVLGILGGYLISRVQEPVYRASTMILVTQGGRNDMSDLLGTNQSLTGTYSELLLTRPVLQGTSERLGYHISSRSVQVQQVRDADIVLLSVEDTDPQRAADAANTLVDVFLEQNASLQQSRYAESEQSLLANIERVQNTIAELEKQLTTTEEESFTAQTQAVTGVIDNLRLEMDTLRNEIATLSYGAPIEVRDPRTYIISVVTATPALETVQQLSAKQARLNELNSLLAQYQQIYVNLSAAGDTTLPSSTRTDRIRAALDLYQNIYSSLLANYETIRQARVENAPNILQVEAATPPVAPVRPQPLMNMAFGLVIGLLLSGGAAALIETANSSLRSDEDVTNLLKLPVLGYISEIAEKDKASGANVPYVLRHPRSPVTEAFRSLRTNLQFVELDRPLNTLLVSSQGTSEGKTTIAVNLAVVIAQTGRRVILVDADLRRPRVHSELGLPNRVGLSNVLREKLDPARALQRYKSDYLSVMTSGGLPPNPAEVLGSQRMVELMKTLGQMADLVILDGPPLVFADSMSLSATADGVLMVVRPNHTDARSAVAIVEQLHRIGARPVGAVLNWIRQNQVGYYGHYKTYARYNVSGSADMLDVETTQPVRTPPGQGRSPEVTQPVEAKEPRRG